MRSKSFIRIFAVMALMVFVVNCGDAANNELAQAMQEVIKEDSRNEGVGMTAYHGKDNTVLVLNMESISGNNSQADVFRVLLQFAAKVKDKTYERVELASKKTVKFQMTGEFFRTLGVEYGSQNPIYTMRTFPQNLFKTDGTSAFPTWTGGVLGVTNKQMEDFGNFHKQWYLNDLIQ